MAIKKKTIKSVTSANNSGTVIHRGIDGDKTMYMYDMGDGTTEMWGFNSDGTVDVDGVTEDGRPLLDRYRIPTSSVKEEDKFIGDTNIGKKSTNNNSQTTSPNINAKTFASAFKQARTAGLDTFTWKGRQYGTRYKNESKSDNTTEKSSNTMSSKLTFGKAFDKARREGLSTFIWRGKKYGTKLKGE